MVASSIGVRRNYLISTYLLIKKTDNSGLLNTRIIKSIEIIYPRYLINKRQSGKRANMIVNNIELPQFIE